MNTLRLNKFSLVIIITIVFSSISVLSSPILQDDKEIKEFALILKQKVLLNSDQENHVIEILSDLQKNITLKPADKQNILKNAQSKIESLLDNKQKMKYDIIKKDLWKKIS